MSQSGSKMASQFDNNDDSGEDSLDSGAFSQKSPVHDAFKSIFDCNIQQFKDALEFIKENKLRLIWIDHREKHGKTMQHAKIFVSNVLDAFRNQYDTVSKEVEGSACDQFQQYFHKRFVDAVDKSGILEKSLEETKKEFARQISEIKEKFEKKEVKETKSKTDIDEIISKTQLLDPVHINHALLCCRVAYECEDLKNPERCLKALPGLHWLSELVVSHENNAVPRYVMARCGDVLYVAFRGLEKINLTDTVKVTTTGKGQINSIIFEEAKKIPLSYFVREIFRAKRVIFTGHSTGGAIASLVVIFLLDELKRFTVDFVKNHLKCITFGMTPFGDKGLKETVNSIDAVKECFFHIVKDDDIIPKLFGSNLEYIQDFLIELVVNLVKLPITVIGAAVLPPSVSFCWNLVMQNLPIPRGRDLSVLGIKKIFFPVFDIFGQYYILKPGTESRPVSGAEANDNLSLKPMEIYNSYQSYLINHRIERYDNDVRNTLVKDYPAELRELDVGDNTKKQDDIFPVVEGIQLENFGGQVAAKVKGKNMWFVHAINIRGLQRLSDLPDYAKTQSKKNDNKFEEYPVEIATNAESVVEINMGPTHLVHFQTVNVRVQSHFQNPKFTPKEKVSVSTTPYDVSERQEQLAKLTPSKVIELAYMSALLERHLEADKRDAIEPHSERFSNVQAFFESVISVVPAEGLFHAIGVSDRSTVVLQCCQLLLASEQLFQERDASKFLIECMEIAIKNLSINEVDEYYRYALDDRRSNQLSFHAIRRSVFSEVHGGGERMENLETIQKAQKLISKYLESRSHHATKTLCGLNLGNIFTASQRNTNSTDSSSVKHPLTLLKDGRNELRDLSEEMSSQHNTVEHANSKMLQKLNGLCESFQTCSALLGSFMEAHVHVPLEFQDDKQARQVAAAAEHGGLTVWALLILPISFVKRIISRVLTGPQKLLIDVTGYMRNFRSDYNRMYNKRRIGVPGAYYDGKLEFLMTSMKKSSSSNKSFITYSLERQLVEECKERNITDSTSLDEILEQWTANFKEETLAIVDEDYRPMIATWIKWSLMINRLREDLAVQTAVGIIGLVNSGKSKFVSSMFGIKTITGTVAEKRTTVPYIYNMGGKIDGLDIIDFPGVDDRDESIPELAKLLLSLTRIVVFVVDYKRAHTEATSEWLRILEEQKVPVLVCLSFADKLFSEHMIDGNYPDNNVVKSALGKQLKHITNQIGQPVHGKRDFKFVVFDLDNDSTLNSEEGRQKLARAGLHDELEVGRWIAEKLLDNKELGTRLLKFINEKKSSTLNLHKSKREIERRSNSEGELSTRGEEARRRPLPEKRPRSSSASNDEATCSKSFPQE